MNTFLAKDVLSSYKKLGMPISIVLVDMGIINKTYLVATEKIKFILQQMSPIFDSTVNEDSDTVCRYLQGCGMRVPDIYRTDDNRLFLSLEGRIFRALRYIDGRTTHTITSLKMAESAGRVVGHFHIALTDFDYDYRSKRPHGGDYDFHRKNLISTLQMHQHHDYFLEVERMASVMLEAFDTIIGGFTTTLRHAHGDPKISNIIFDEQDDAVALVDFDTLGKTGWSLEMADALRSWCNPHREDVLEAYVDLQIAEKALLGYGTVMRHHFSEKEIVELVTHSQAITLCLGLRYLTDVLNEKYWVYDQKRFSRPAEHNFLRAKSMHNLFQDFLAKKSSISLMAHDFLL